MAKKATRKKSSKRKAASINVNIDECSTKGKAMKCGSGGCIYGLGFIGAVIYYISTATSFWMGVLGVLKALVWPAFLVYELLKHLGM